MNSFPKRAPIRGKSQAPNRGTVKAGGGPVNKVNLEFINPKKKP